MSYTSELLQSYLKEKKRVNPSYSLRAFARDLNINRTTLSDCINDNVKLGQQSCEKIRSKLELQEKEFAKLLYDNQLSSDDLAIDEISLDDFSRINHVLHFGVLGLLKNKTRDWSYEDISSRFDVSNEEIKKCLDELIEVGFVEHKEGLYKRVLDSFRTTDNIPSDEIKKYHFENLSYAKKSIEQTSIEARDISTVTFLVNKNDLPKIKEEIKGFRRTLGEKYYDPESEDVYSLSISLYPLSHPR